MQCGNCGEATADLLCAECAEGAIGYAVIAGELPGFELPEDCSCRVGCQTVCSRDKFVICKCECHKTTLCITQTHWHNPRMVELTCRFHNCTRFIHIGEKHRRTDDNE